MHVSSPGLLVPSRGFCPTTSSKITHPSDHSSMRASYDAAPYKQRERERTHDEELRRAVPERTKFRI